MKVYRICNKEEVNALLNDKDFSNVGKEGLIFIQQQIKDDTNNHNYEPKEKYLHFFKSLHSIFYLNTNEGYYICTYDIPDEVLKDGSGIGKYWDFMNFSHLVNVEEYAINIKNLKFDYLEKIDEITEYIDVEDYLYNFSIEDFLTTIYNKTPSKKLIKSFNTKTNKLL